MMSDYALKVENLTKKYDGFLLDKVSFYVPKGNIVGLIGENGAGKSTTINTMLEIVQKDSGDIYILDSKKNKIDNDIRERIGVVFDGNNFPEDLTPNKLNNVLKAIYKNWEEKKFFELLEKFSLSKDKKIKKFSRGMKMKLSISVALSHKAELLILDEATSGLDPVVRDDILDILLDFVQDDDLEKVKSLYSLINRPTDLRELVKSNGEDVAVKINDDHDSALNYSLVSATYDDGNHGHGLIAILGPTNMHYSQVIGMLNTFRNELSKRLINYYRNFNE